MKKMYFIIAFILYSVGAFPNSQYEQHDLSSWFTLLFFGLLFIGYFTYLFIKAQNESAERSRLLKADEPKENVKNENLTETNLLKITDGLLKLFNLKKKGFISEREYNRLKEKLYQNGS